MVTITIEEAQMNLAGLIRRLQPGEEVAITDNEKTVAKLVAAPQESPPHERKLGTMRGSVLSMEHFDDPLDDFAVYM